MQRRPNSISGMTIEPIPIDVHQHYVPSSDGFLGTKPACEVIQQDVEFWELQKTERLKKFKLTGEDYNQMFPRPVLGQMKPYCKPDFPSIVEILENQILEHTLLISQTFEISEDVNPNSYQWEKPEYITAINQHVSNLASQNSDKLSGLCGLNYSWSEHRYATEVQNCLEMKGLVGFKFYWNDELDSLEKLAQKNLNNFFMKLKGKKRIVLWHVDLPMEEEIESHKKKFIYEFKNKSIKEILTDSGKVNNLVYWIVNNPNIIFIFAHGFYSTTMIEALFANLEQNNHQVDNVYFDLSATSMYMNAGQQLNIAPVARNIGLHRFLFGTDGIDPIVGYKVYRDRYGFKQNEFEQIVYKNGLHFLDKVIYPIKNEVKN